ncbi:MAG: 2OG-Fe(II) oxygenase family protein [Pseudomonadota bacterium]
MSDIKIVNIASLWTQDESARAQTDTAIWQALQSTGAIVISDYPGYEKVDAWAQAASSIHDAADLVKKSLTIAVYEKANTNFYRGYHPRVPGGAFKVNIYDIGPADPAAGPDLPGIEYMTEPNPWPPEADLPDWRHTVTECYRQLNEVSQQIMLSIGRSAGFDERTIFQRFAGEHSTLRMLDYPDIDHNDTDGVAAYRHVDASALSLLWQREPGLQAEAPDGVFYDVPMIDNCISVHVGTVMEQLTGGRVRATPHRVLGTGGVRRSMGFFLEPALSAPITSAENAVTAQPEIQDTYAWLLLKTHHSREKYADLIPDPETAFVTGI